MNNITVRYGVSYLGCNLAFENFVGKSKNEIIGKNDFELFDEKVALNFREEDLKVLKTFDIYTNNEEIKINNTILQFQSKKKLIQAINYLFKSIITK